MDLRFVEPSRVGINPGWSIEIRAANCCNSEENFESSLRPNGSRERSPDDGLREVIQLCKTARLLRRFAPRNDEKMS
jgi:hypothetical protein